MAALAATKLIVTGQRELERDFRRMANELKKQEHPTMRAIADPVLATARSLASPYSSATAAGYRSRIRGFSVRVEQSLSKTTGQHAQYGKLQVERMLEPALEQNQGEVDEKVEEMLDGIHAKYGF